jgi:5-methylcytosine-specific restriction endonuclease McrA
VSRPGSRPRGRAWERLRRQILVRDGGICGLCGLPGATSVDHRIPLVAGGHPTDPGNLQAAHLSCNVIKENERRRNIQRREHTSRHW